MEGEICCCRLTEAINNQFKRKKIEGGKETERVDLFEVMSWGSVLKITFLLKSSGPVPSLKRIHLVYHGKRRFGPCVGR